MMLTILGPTASGKTLLAAHLASRFNGEVISADSRQVYRDMTIGTGKDYADYIVNGTRVHYHLIDIVEPGTEYNIFRYQQDFSTIYKELLRQGKRPILCGGSGMYLEVVLKGYRLPVASDDPAFLSNLEGKTEDELTDLLKSVKTLHNITDVEDRERMIKALLIEHQSRNSYSSFAPVPSVIFGISWPRGLLRHRITQRLEQRMQGGLIEETAQLLTRGITPERLMKYGLEYKFTTLFLNGKISKEQLFSGLNTAIHQFAKRQMTWFRRMERQGFKIHWIDGRLPLDDKMALATDIVKNME
ncbi:MAG: tRNA (adenosine(37)-N6)-dimethylallyltransferase MiaA [Bacteroidales bacterium]|nr:tRNA (adenosine(37)-N6)-dimethylallyltransferase MiaA [Bacteroidales bacterium]